MFFQIGIGIAIAISISDEDRDRDRDLDFGDRGHSLYVHYYSRRPMIREIFLKAYVHNYSLKVYLF